MADFKSTLPVTDSSDGTAGSAVPALTLQVGGSDGTDLRTFKTDTSGNIVVTPVDGYKSSYSATHNNYTPGSTDIFTITGSATKTIRVLRVEVSFTQSIYSENDVLLIKRSTANSGGTSAAITAVPHDSSDAAATAIVLAYTANPTLGSTVGTIRAAKVFGQATSEPYAGSSIVSWTFGDRPSQAIVLRGTTQVLAVNLNSTSITGGNFDISVEWTEE
jgi:hypothetical protein